MASRNGNRGRCYRCARRIVGETGSERCAAVCFNCTQYVWHDFAPVGDSEFCGECGRSAWSAFGAHSGSTHLDHLNEVSRRNRLVGAR